MTHGGDSELEQFLRHPLAWVFGAIMSVGAVAGAVFSDPTGSVATVLMALFDLAPTIFTGASIAGFTLAPEFPWLPQREIQIVAIVFGIIFVGQIADRVWDSIKSRVDDD